MSKDISRLMNAAWTAGFNSGARALREFLEKGVEPTKEELQAKATDMLREDAEGVMLLFNLEKEMGGGK